MQKTLDAADVRKKWSGFNDDVIHSGPRFVKWNRDERAALNTDHLESILESFSLKVDLYTEDDGSKTASLSGFDLVENGETESEALDLLTEELIGYAEEYQDNRIILICILIPPTDGPTSPIF